MNDSNNTPDDITGGAPTLDELQSDIERTREELAETVDLLAAKLDVKTRVRDQFRYTATATRESAAHQYRSVRDQVTNPDGKPKPEALAIVGGVIAVVVAAAVARLWLGRSGR